MRPTILPTFLLLASLACTTWRPVDEPIENGVTLQDVGCAQTFFVGEPAHPGMPLLPMDPLWIDRVTRRLNRDVPGLRAVGSVSEADLVVSVIFVQSLPLTTHAPPEPEMEWSVILEKGGASHQREYSGMGGHLSFSGRLVIGGDVAGGFARQLATLRASHACGG